MIDQNQPSTQEIQLIEESKRLSKKLLQRPRGPQRYITEKEIGRGAMGIINKVYDQDLLRITAMKIIQPQIVDMYSRFNAFVSEARLTAELEHPNIVPIHQLGIIDENGSPFYTMKLVEGEPLHEIINELKEATTEYLIKYNRHNLLNIFRSVCNAIAYAHSHQVIHRDIKPENIMIGQFGEVLVMDWGLAKKLGEDDQDIEDAKREITETKNLLKTQDGMIKGSPAYISPEQAYGEIQDVDEKTDIFLLGSTLYHILCHYPPYEGGNIMEIIEKAETCNHPPLSERNPKCKIPLELERIVNKAMAPLKQNRYKDVNQMIADIDAFITGRRVSGRKLFSPGNHLIEAGKESSECYIIVDGKVEVHREADGKKISIATFGAGEIIGEMAGITQTVSSATVTALEATDTLVITHELIEEELQKLPPWLEHIIISMTKRLRTSVNQANPLLLEGRAFPIISQLNLIFQSVSLMTREEAKTISLNIIDVIDEVTIHIHVQKSVVERIIAVLISSKLCAVGKNNSLVLPNSDIFGEFILYYRRIIGIDKGIKKSLKLDLPTATESRFNKIVIKLNQLFPSR